MRRIGPDDLPAGIYGLIWRHTPGLQVATLALGFVAPFVAVLPLEIQRRIVDDAIPAGDLGLLARLAFVYLALATLGAAAKFGVFVLRGLIAARVSRALRDHAMAAQAARPQAEAHRAAPVLTAVMDAEADDIGGFASEALNAPLIEGGSLVAVSGFLLVAAPPLALALIALILVQALTVVWAQQRINRLTTRRIFAVRGTNAHILSRAEGGASRHRDALAGVRRIFAVVTRLYVAKGAVKAFLKLSDTLGVAVVLGVGGAMVVSGQTTLGVVVAFLSGLTRMREPWHALLDYYRLASDARLKFALVRAAQRQEPPLDSRPDAA
jgi:ABC-type multidrug transport system fused ATPase/permease subunit